MKLPAGQLERLQDRQNLFDSRQGGQRLGLQLALVANHADDGAQFSAAQVGTQAKLLDSLQDVIDLRRR